MTTFSLTLVVALAVSGQYEYGNIQKKEFDDLKATQKKLWQQDLVVKLADLPLEAKMPDYRVPYSGHDYPDKTGGTIVALSKYDKAFYPGRSPAAGYERQDIAFHTTVKTSKSVPRYGRFGRVLGETTVETIPHWYGHCNGWTAASIRHAEPEKSVTRNGVVFTPADIKGLLAEAYMYSPTQFLGGLDDAINPATFHLVLGNWLGRNGHPIGMESSLGPEVVNFPLHGYKSTIRNLNSRQAEVRTTISFAVHVNKETDKSPRNRREMFFHYILDLDGSGNIVGGHNLRDGGRLDMVWVPLQLAQGGEKENPSGNPHLNAKELLSIWRESVSEETLKKWKNVDPREEELILVKEEKPAEATPATASTDEKPAETAKTETAEAKPAEEKPTEEKPAEESPAAAPAVAEPTAAAVEPAPAAAP